MIHGMMLRWVGLVVLCLGVSASQAADINVNTSVDLATGCGVTGPCSLRAAIAVATPTDVVRLPAGTYTLTLTAEADIDVTSPVMLVGEGNPVIKSTGAWRIFEVDGGSLSLKGVSLQDGDARTMTGCFNGGGAVCVRGGGTLALEDVAITNGKAVFGGAIYADASTTTLTRVTISGSTAAGSGGGLTANGGSLRIDDSTISGNTATADDGGGLALLGVTADVANSTISGNMAGRRGGGIAVDVVAGAVTLGNVTIASNTAPQGGGFVVSPGATGLPRVVNSLLANNTTGDCVGAFDADSKNNLVEAPGTACTVPATPGSGNIVGRDPVLSGLAANGGTTLTQALGAASPAVNAGDVATCAAKDQRGQNRICDDGNCDRCDIGAYELATDSDTDGRRDFADNCPDDINADQADADGDGAGDVCDDCPTTSETKQLDTDTDGIGDACDNCATIPNKDQADLDHDGIGDVCNDADGDGAPNGVDACPGTELGGPDAPLGYGTSESLPTFGCSIFDLCPCKFRRPESGDDEPAKWGGRRAWKLCVRESVAQRPVEGVKPRDVKRAIFKSDKTCGNTPRGPKDDHDWDGVKNKDDNCPRTYNKDQKDEEDGDGIGNACDKNDDNDERPDRIDNCATKANVDQYDQDHDGIGDPCDPDNDNDRVPDDEDNCPAVANNDQRDRDGDELGDACDACPKTDPERIDEIDEKGCPPKDGTGTTDPDEDTE